MATGGCLPTPDQQLFLKACIGEGQDAIAAWEEWKKTHTLVGLEQALFRLLPLLYHNLQQAGYDGSDMAALKGTYRRNWYHNQTLFHTLEQVLAVLRSAGIKTLMMKGVALCHGYYPDPWTRCMSDADLMVPADRADEAIELLRQSGWIIKVPLKMNYKEAFHACLLVNKEGQEMDLHWHLFIECCAERDDDPFWQRAAPLMLRTEETLTLSPTDHLLHTCIHGYVWNAMPPLRWVADAYFILQKQGIDWPMLVTQARELHMGLRLHRSLLFLKNEYAMPIPDDTLAQLAALPVDAFERYEHDVLTQVGRRQHLLKRHIIRPLQKVWCMQQRHYPNRTLAQRIVHFPLQVSHEMRLETPWHLPLAAMRYVMGTYRVKPEEKA